MIAAAWVFAIVALVAMLVGCGLLLARRFIRLLEAVGDFFGAAVVLDGVQPSHAEQRPLPSVLEPVAEARERRAGFQRQKTERKLQRHFVRLERGRDLIAPWRTH